MQRFASVLVVLAACASPSPQMLADDDEPPVDAAPVDTGLQPPEHGFQIKTPTVDLAPGADVTYCYYFHTSNDAYVAIQKWQSRMPAAGVRLTLYFSTNDMMPPETMTTDLCGPLGGKARWSYAAEAADASMTMPADDGDGVPVGQMIAPAQSGFLQVHYHNASADTVQAHTELNGYAYPNLDVRSAAPFVTYSTGIRLPPGTAAMPGMTTAGASCAVEADKKFFALTTHTHKQGVRTTVKDGDTMLFSSTDWARPGAQAWATTPFYGFKTGLTYECEYANRNNYRIETGYDEATDEVCMAIGFYFPAPYGGGTFCQDGTRM